MKPVLVDSNVLLDIFTEDNNWYEWSSSMLEKLAEDHTLSINPIIYSEISIGFERIEELEVALPKQIFKRLNIPSEAAFLAGKIFVKYKKNGGKKHSTMPDFFIGAHAAVNDMLLLTRDKKRYVTYFPKLELISP